MYGILTYIYHKSGPNVGKYARWLLRFWDDKFNTNMCFFYFCGLGKWLKIWVIGNIWTIDSEDLALAEQWTFAFAFSSKLWPKPVPCDSESHIEINDQYQRKFLLEISLLTMHTRTSAIHPCPPILSILTQWQTFKLSGPYQYFLENIQLMVRPGGLGPWNLPIYHETLPETKRSFHEK